MLITSGNNVPFYAYQHLISRFMPIRVFKKLCIAFVRFEFLLPPKHSM